MINTDPVQVSLFLLIVHLNKLITMCVKGIVHPKMKILSVFTLPHRDANYQ